MENLIPIAGAALILGVSAYILRKRGKKAKKLSRPTSMAGTTSPPEPSGSPIADEPSTSPETVATGPAASPQGPIEAVWLNDRPANNDYVEPLKVKQGRGELILRVRASAYPDPDERAKARESVRLAGFALWLPTVEEVNLGVHERTEKGRYAGHRYGSDHFWLLPKKDRWDAVQGDVIVENDPESQHPHFARYVVSWVGDEEATLEITVPFMVNGKPEDPKTMVYVDFSVQRMHAKGTLGGRLPIVFG